MSIGLRIFSSCGDFVQEFPSRLSTIRKAKKIKQREVADFLGQTTRAYQRYENGTNGPGVENLVRLADYFDVSIDYLVGRDDIPNRKG